MFSEKKNRSLCLPTEAGFQDGKYNASTGEYTAFKGAKGKDDIDELNNRCNNLFTVSRMILDNNVYAEVFGDTHVTGK